MFKSETTDDFHSIDQMGTWISHLRDSNTLIEEQDNKLLKNVSCNSIDPAYFIPKQVALTKAINLAKERPPCEECYCEIPGNQSFYFQN
jgi:hypothetical protein